MNRDEAWTLLNEYTKSESLLKHALAVEAAMRHYANNLGENVEQWGLPAYCTTSTTNAGRTSPTTRRRGEDFARTQCRRRNRRAILSHAEWNQSDYPLDRPIRKALFAVDELSGFIVAVAYVRPEKLDGMTPKSVRKK